MERADDPRLGSLISSYSSAELPPWCAGDGPSHVVLIGWRNDEGVKRNGGIPGAYYGPHAFRSFLQTAGPVKNAEHDIDVATVPVFDAGDASGCDNVYSALESRVREVIDRGGIPFVVGGGNDQSYANACGLLSSRMLHHYEGQSVGVVNIDAHLDVRPLHHGIPHSGTSFRQLLEDDRFDGRHFVEYAAQGEQCSYEHASYVREMGGRIVWLSQVRSNEISFAEVLDDLGDVKFVSFDLDAVAGRDAPGVSCPSPIGLSSEEALNIMMLAGQDPRVRLVDVSEYNPKVERSRTGKLVAMMFYHFLMGVAKRFRRSPLLEGEPSRQGEANE